MRGPRLRGETMSATRPHSSPVVLQHKLTLNDFPMEYGVKDALQRSVTSRQERSRLQDRLQSARKESETLREYSRRRFQTVVDWEMRPAPQPVTVPKIQTSSRPKTTTGARASSIPQPPLTPTTPTNGPTKDGSILYNGKPLLLSSIRTRPNSEPPSRFDHLRGAHGKAYPYIQKTLEQSNCEYRVGASPCQTAREDRREDGFSPDFVMLIPVTSEVSDVTARDGDDVDADEEGGRLGWQKGQAWMEDGPLLASTARSRSPRSEEMSEIRLVPDTREANEGQGRRDFSRDIEVNRLQETRPASASPTPTMTISQPPPDDPNLNPTTPPPSPPPRQTPSPPPPRPTHTDPRSKKKTLSPTPRLLSPDRPPSRASSCSRPHSARSSVSSVSSVSITPRPHCWVDDVTVSSVESLTERDLSLQNELDDRLSVHSQDVAGAHSQLLGVTAHLPRAGSPSGAEKKKSMLIGKRVTSPLLKCSPSGGKAKGREAGGGGCPRSFKQSTTSGSKAGGRYGKEGERDGLGVVREGEEGEGGGELVLPRFLCPSSESKSRQVAIKEWLAKTSFASACRTVPLT